MAAWWPGEGSVGQAQAMARAVHVQREGPERSGGNVPSRQSLRWPGGCLRKGKQEALRERLG